MPVWGWAGPGEQVTVAFAGQTATVKAMADGTGKGVLAASAAQRELTVRSGNQIVVKNLVVGDVWICSGQSKMADGWGGLSDEQHQADFPLIRHVWFHAAWCKTPRAETECDPWRGCGPETVGGFSAGLFTRKLHAELGVSIDLLAMDAGSNRGEPWIAPEALRAVPELREIAGLVENVDISTPEGNRAYVEAAERLKSWIPHAEQMIREKRGFIPMSKLPLLTMGSERCGLFNSQVFPVAPFAVKASSGTRVIRTAAWCSRWWSIKTRSAHSPGGATAAWWPPAARMGSSCGGMSATGSRW